MGKYKAPPISHRFFLMANFVTCWKMKSCKLSKGVFERKSENLPYFDKKKRVKLAIIRALVLLCQKCKWNLKKIYFFWEGVATIMSTGCSFKSSFKDCRREICLNLRRDTRYPGSSLHHEIEKNEILAFRYWKCEWTLVKSSCEEKVSCVNIGSSNYEKRDVKRLASHRALWKFLDTYNSGHVPTGYITQLPSQPLIQVHCLFVNWFVCFTYLRSSVF